MFNVNKFKARINRLKSSSKYEHIFNGDERELIEDIIEIGNARIPNSSAFTGKGTTERAVDEARKAVVSKVPVVGERAQGLLVAVQTLKSDSRLLDVTTATDNALR